MINVVSCLHFLFYQLWIVWIMLLLQKQKCHPVCFNGCLIVNVTLTRNRLTIPDHLQLIQHTFLFAFLHVTLYSPSLFLTVDCFHILKLFEIKNKLLIFFDKLWISVKRRCERTWTFNLIKFSFNQFSSYSFIQFFACSKPCDS